MEQAEREHDDGGKEIRSTKCQVPSNKNESQRPAWYLVLVANQMNALPQPEAVPSILVDHITKKYGDFTAVDDVSFSVADGEIFGLLGPNGAGKSTLIRMMTTLLPITAGRALIAGHDVSREPDAARRMMGVIPQAMTSDLDLTLEENLNI